MISPASVRLVKETEVIRIDYSTRKNERIYMTKELYQAEANITN